MTEVILGPFLYIAGLDCTLCNNLYRDPTFPRDQALFDSVKEKLPLNGKRPHAEPGSELGMGERECHLLIVIILYLTAGIVTWSH